jgi:ABC-type Fe3+-citrate transport system substrate-binding protein
MKKILAIVATLAAASVFVTGCGSKAAQNEQQGSPALSCLPCLFPS